MVIFRNSEHGHHALVILQKIISDVGPADEQSTR